MWLAPSTWPLRSNKMYDFTSSTSLSNSAGARSPWIFERGVRGARVGSSYLDSGSVDQRSFWP